MRCGFCAGVGNRDELSRPLNAASKAALAHLGEGLSIGFANTPIRVSTIFPGYIRTPLNDHVARLPFEVDSTTGTQALIKAIERESRLAYVPS
jgi:NAD(P)-dependent dehydrogenase (short-subunit alcohol dehydrogenase family)